MEPGSYEVRVTLEGHQAATAPFRILEGTTERVELTLRLSDN